MAERPLLLTVAQAAQDLSISPRHLYNLIERGDIASVKVGQCRRITTEELDRYVTALSAEATHVAAS